MNNNSDLETARRFLADNLGAPFQEAMDAVKRFEPFEFNRTISSFEYDAYLITS